MLLIVIGCKKSKDPLDNYVNNNISISVSSANGSVSTYNFHGELAPMFRSIWGGEFGAEGKTSSTDTQISFSQIYMEPSGTKVSCAYTRPIANTYYTSSITNPGTITFAKLTGDWAEGSFNVKCGYLSDTLLIAGSFSGHIN